MPPENMLVVSYRCPRCDAALEARTSEADSWLRCPRCGRASLPPDTSLTPPPLPSSPPLSDDALLGGFPAGSLTPRRSSPVSGWRVFVGLAFLSSLSMLTLQFMDGNAVNVGIFGITTLVLLVLLGVTGQRR